jgi:hypothetical protein
MESPAAESAKTTSTTSVDQVLSSPPTAATHRADSEPKLKTMKVLSVASRGDPGKTFVNGFKNCAFHYGQIQTIQGESDRFYLLLKGKRKGSRGLQIRMPQGVTRPEDGQIVKLMCSIQGVTDSNGHTYPVFFARSFERPNVLETRPRNVLDSFRLHPKAAAADEQASVDKVKSVDDALSKMERLVPGSDNHVQLAGLCVGAEYLPPSDSSKGRGTAIIYLRQDANARAIIPIYYSSPHANRVVEQLNKDKGSFIYLECTHQMRAQKIAKLDAEGKQVVDDGMPVYELDEHDQPKVAYHSYLVSREPMEATERDILFLREDGKTAVPNWIRDYAQELQTAKTARQVRSTRSVAATGDASFKEGGATPVAGAPAAKATADELDA